MRVMVGLVFKLCLSLSLTIDQNSLIRSLMALVSKKQIPTLLLYTTLRPIQLICLRPVKHWVLGVCFATRDINADTYIDAGKLSRPGKP